jgi:hypothetical protein
MNLHGIASNIVNAVNPNLICQLQLSTGYTLGADFSQIPTYTTYANQVCQVQEITAKDLRQMDALNIQRSDRCVYLNGNWQGVVRVGVRGGDILTTPDGNVWLVTGVLELWPDWVKISVTLQNGN